MSELRVVATITANPGAEQAVGSALRDLVTATRREDGCLDYDLYESIAEPGTFITVERWRSQADLDAHMQTPHIAAVMSEQRDNLAGLAIHPLRDV